MWLVASRMSFVRTRPVEFRRRMCVREGGKWTLARMSFSSVRKVRCTRLVVFRRRMRISEGGKGTLRVWLAIARMSFSSVREVVQGSWSLGGCYI